MTIYSKSVAHSVYGMFTGHVMQSQPKMHPQQVLSVKESAALKKKKCCILVYLDRFFTK